MNTFIERKGILVNEQGEIFLRQNGDLKRVRYAQPEEGDQGESKGFGFPWFWDVVFDDGTRAKISGLTMKAALYRRAMECSMDVLNQPYPGKQQR